MTQNHWSTFTQRRKEKKDFWELFQPRSTNPQLTLALTPSTVLIMMLSCCFCTCASMPTGPTVCVEYNSKHSELDNTPVVACGILRKRFSQWKYVVSGLLGWPTSQPLCRTPLLAGWYGDGRKWWNLFADMNHLNSSAINYGPLSIPTPLECRNILLVHWLSD